MKGIFRYVFILPLYFLLINYSPVYAQPFAQPVLNPFSLFHFDPFLKLSFADLDGDNDLDIVTGSEFGDFYLIKNIGDSAHPVFDPSSMSSFDFDVYMHSSPSFADLDNDGDLDMISGSVMGTIFCWKNIGNVQNPIFDTIPFPGFNISVPSNYYYTTPALVDLDNDGDYDVMIGGNVLLFYENIGNSITPSYNLGQTPSIPDSNNKCCPSFCDFDGDGDLDMLTGSMTGFYYYENIGNINSPMFNMPVHNPFNLNGGSDDSPLFVDLDDDGDFDIMHGSISGDFVYWENILITGASGISEKNDITINYLYSNSMIHMSGKKPFQIFISDLMGREIRKLFSSRNELQIDVSSLGSGIYLLRVENDYEFFTVKFLK